MDSFPIPSLFGPFPQKTRSPGAGDENHDIRTATNRIDRFPTERKALDKLRAGDWEGFGREMDALGAALAE